MHVIYYIHIYSRLHIFAVLVIIIIHGCNYQSFQILVVVYSCGGPEGRDSPNVLRDNTNVLCDNPDIQCDNAKVSNVLRDNPNVLSEGL